ncbi:MAG: hypothetical protein ACTSSP_11900, partial [Candidatus Asgardarchaeia archaeon]
NKEKIKRRRKKYYIENKEKIKEQKKEYYEKNKEKIKEQQKKYAIDNKDQIMAQKRKYQSRPEIADCRSKWYRKYWAKRRKDPIIRLNENISKGIRNSLNFNGISKNGRHWEFLVGYTLQDLKEHLEKLFQPGMSWNNSIEWHIDHIIPKSFFKYKSTDDVEFKYCWSLNNLQPLWAKDNIIKGNKIIYGAA